MTTLGLLIVAALQLATPARQGVQPGALPAAWPTGAPCPETPEFRTHVYNDDFVILRQSGCTNFEKPFLYLLFGTRATMLVDTGAGGVDVGAAVRTAMNAWAVRRGGPPTPLIVVHSHGHRDHTAGDVQFGVARETTVVPATAAALQQFFGLARWPDDVAAYDLGDRTIDVIPIPGHEPASIAIYDRRTGILLTGDTLYPGRLYVRDRDAYTRSIQRLVAFTEGKIVTHVLGAHIENARTPYVDYPEGTIYQPDEHALELGRAHLLELADALRQMNGNLARRALRDFTIWPIER